MSKLPCYFENWMAEEELDSAGDVCWYVDHVHCVEVLEQAARFAWKKTVQDTIQAIMNDKAGRPAPTSWEMKYVLSRDSLCGRITIEDWAKCKTLEARTQMVWDVMETYRRYWRILSRTPEQAKEYQGLSEVQKLMAIAGYEDWLFKP